MQLADKWGAKALKNNPLHPMDYTFIRCAKTVGFAEIKCRNVPHDRYPDYMLSANKVLACKRLAVNIPCVLVVRWADNVTQWLDLFTLPDRLSKSGRWDRNDPQDIEWCLHWKMERFKTL